MKGIRHPFSGALYERDGEGNLLVTRGEGADQEQGRFRPDGSWIDGELRECDPQLCGWVAGPQVANHRVATADEAPA